MNNILPITIKLEESLNKSFNKLSAITNRLEAQFNFQTLTAGWYGDEENIIGIQLLLESSSSFRQISVQHKNLSTRDILVSKFSDDVISYFNKIEQQIFCHIAITEKETQLFNQQPKILVNLIEKKLHKVLTLIARKHQLPCF